MADVTALLRTLTTGAQLTASDNDSWVEVACPHCGNPRQVMVAAEVDGSYTPKPTMTKWLRCPVCRQGLDSTEG